MGFNSPVIFLICLCVLACKFVSHKELRREFNHTVLLCWDEVSHCIIGLLVCAAKWKIECWKCFLRNRKTPKLFGALPQNPPVLFTWVPLGGGLQCPPKPPSCFVTCFASESASHAPCFPLLCWVTNPLSRIYLMSILM